MARLCGGRARRLINRICGIIPQRHDIAPAYCATASGIFRRFLAIAPGVKKKGGAIRR